MTFSARSLVIVPCGKDKIWHKNPERGAVPARDTYTGAPFVVDRAYAERFGDAWVVLSAKYGFLPPDHMIPGPYEVSFKDPTTQPVSIAQLHEQVRAQGLDRFDRVIGLGGKEYRHAIEAAFAPWPVRLVFPFAGLLIGKVMQATKQAVTSGDPRVEIGSR